MLKSMTAFGRARKLSSDNSLDITAEIKSVNSRYLDCTVKISRMYSFLEEKVKAYIAESGITRGKVEVYIGVDVLAQKGVEVILDTEAAKSYIASLEQLRDTFGLKDDITVMKVAGNRDLFAVKKPDDDMERDWEDIRAVLSAAIDSFLAAREREGENLKADILAKADKIKACAAQVKTLSEADIDGYKTKLDTRIHQLLENYTIQIDEQRILTEVAIFADRAAIDEELVRLKSHFSAFDEAMDSDQPVGRRLDFLLQEMNREVNTTGSKSNDSTIAALVVDAKCELEKIREQIQNLE